MTSRALFFNLMKEDLKKKVWIVVAALIAFIFINPVHTLMEIEGAYANMYLTPENIASTMQYYLSAAYFGNSVLPAILAVVLGISGFSFLFSKKKVDLYHSIPVKREKLFAVSYLNGILIYLGVFIITQLLTILTMTMQGLMNADGWKTVGLTFIGITIHFLFFYHVTIIAVMLTGNMLVCMAGVITLLFYGPMMCQMVDGFSGHYFVTYYPDYINGSSWLVMPLLSPVSSLIYLTSSLEIAERNIGMNLLAAFLVSMILLAAAVLLYKKRPSETAGKALCYKISEPIIRIMVVIPISLLGGLYIQNMTNGLSGIWFWFGLLFTGILCHVIMEVIYRFDFKAALNHKIQLAGSLVAAALFALCFQQDWVGYETYIPEADQVESAAVVLQSLDRDVNAYDIITDKDGNVTLAYADKNAKLLKNMKLTNIQDVLSMAQTGIEQLDYSDTSNMMPRAALIGKARVSAAMNAETETEELNLYTIRYRLKNGREVTRNYRATISSTIDAMANIYDQTEYKQAAFALLELKDSGFIHTINGYNAWGDKIMSVSDEDMQELLDLYTEELQGITIETLQKEMPMLRLDLMYTASASYEDSIYGYYVYPSFEKTLEKMAHMGIKADSISNEINPENIESISINDYGYSHLIGEVESENYNSEVIYATENGSEDQAKIKELCDHLVLGNFLWNNSILHPVEPNLDFNIQLNKTAGVQMNGYAQAWKGEVPAFLVDDLKENVLQY